MAEPKSSLVSDTLALDEIETFDGGEVVRLVVETSPGVYVSAQTNLAALRAYVADYVVGAAPGALDTINELAAALGNDANYAATVTAALAGKQPLAAALTSWASVSRAANFDAFVATPSSDNLRALMTDKTGTGAAVFATSPTLVTPILGAANATTITIAQGTITDPASALAITTTWNDPADTFTALDINATNTNSAAASMLINARVNGSSMFNVSRLGVVTSGLHYQAAAAGAFYWNGRSGLYSPANGNIQLTNAAGSDFGLLQFGLTTSAAPAWKRNTTVLEARLADDSAYTTVRALHYINEAGGDFYWQGRSKIGSPADGQITISNNAKTDFARLNLGGVTAGFVALKRNGAGLDIRVGDDTAYAPIAVASIELGHATANTLTAVGGVLSIEGNAVWADGGGSARMDALAGGSVAQGDILYRNASGWVRLGAGTNGQYLKTQGAGANPVWASVGGGGDVIAANNGSEYTAAATTFRSNIGIGTGDSPQFAGLNIGHATDTTITRVAAGRIAVEGAELAKLAGPALTGSVSINRNGGSLPAVSCALGISFNGGGTAYGISLQPQADGTTAIEFRNAAGSGVGTITTDGSTTTYNTTSDRALKENIEDTTLGLETLLQLRVRDFNFITTRERRLQGFIAQEVAQVYGQAVTPGDRDRPWSMDHGRLTPLITRAVQQLHDRLAALEQRAA